MNVKVCLSISVIGGSHQSLSPVIPVPLRGGWRQIIALPKHIPFSLENINQVDCEFSVSLTL